jgi:hypothetical protein
MPTQLTPQDLQFLSAMPQPGQVTGGIDAFNQAAFGNPVAAANPFGILPTAPPAASPLFPPAAAPAPPPPMQQPQQQNPLQQQQFLDLIRQRLGLAGGPRGAAQGGPGVGSTAAKEALSNFERSNVAVSPSIGSALATAQVAMGPAGLVGALAGNALKSAFGVDGILGSAFNTPGPTLNQMAMDAVTKAFYGKLNATASNIQQALAAARATLDVERGLAGTSGHGTVSLSGTGATPIGGWGTTSAGELTGNFTSGLGNRLIGGVDFGGPGSTGGGGIVGSGGGADTGGGMGGGVGHGAGASRST